MKIRAGFVSNSSSSSFTIATRSRLVFGYNGESLLDGVLKSILKVPEESPLYDITNRMAGCLAAQADEITLDEMVEERNFESVAQMLEYDPFLAKAVSKGASSLRAWVKPSFCYLKNEGRRQFPTSVG